EILTKQYKNKPKKFTPEYMMDRWVESDKFTLVKNIPIWVVSPFKYVKPDDKSYSTGPLIVDYDKSNYPHRYGSFGSKDIYKIIDGKHRWWQYIRDGKETVDAFVGDVIIDEIEEWVEEFWPRRERFVEALDDYYFGDEDVDEMWEAGEECGLTQNQLDDLVEEYENGNYFDPSTGEFVDESELTKSRFAHAGDADDCGHEVAGHQKGGKFTEGNTCAGGGKKEEKKSFEDMMEDISDQLDKEVKEKGKSQNKEPEWSSIGKILESDNGYETYKKIESEYADQLGDGWADAYMFSKNGDDWEYISKKDYAKQHPGPEPSESDFNDGYINYNSFASKVTTYEYEKNDKLSEIHNDEKFSSVFMNWSDDEKNSLNYYTGGNYSPMNNYLRKGDYLNEDAR